MAALASKKLHILYHQFVYQDVEKLVGELQSFISYRPTYHYRELVNSRVDYINSHFLYSSVLPRPYMSMRFTENIFYISKQLFRYTAPIYCKEWFAFSIL